MTEDERGLLNAILIYPHDDMPRLVYADWLTENGQDERAEFIRLGCEVDTVHGRTGPAWKRLKSLVGPKNPRKDWFPGTAGIKIGFRGPNPGNGHSILVERGFCDEVRGTMGFLIGGECPDCLGRRSRMHPGIVGVIHANCPTCHGTGRTPGNLHALVRQNPITRVVATDRTPFHLTTAVDGRHRWSWHDSPRGYFRADLPSNVFAVLKCEEDGSVTGAKRYFSEQAAWDALSDALIHVAKFGNKKPVTWHVDRCMWSSDAIEIPLLSVEQPPESVLPAAIFDRLDGHGPQLAKHGYKFYDTEDAAYAALWEALVTA